MVPSIPISTPCWPWPAPTSLLGQQLLAGDLSFVPGETFHFSTIPWTATTTGLVIVHIRDRAGRMQVERVVVGW